MLVMWCVSFPTYVNVTHLRPGGRVTCCRVYGLLFVCCDWERVVAHDAVDGT
jgi:hypothetical protein